MFLNKNLFVLLFVTLFQSGLVCSETDDSLNFVISFNQTSASKNDMEFLKDDESAQRLLSILSEENTYDSNFQLCGRVYKESSDKDTANQLIGIVLFKKMMQKKENSLFINSIHISSQYQRMGIGTQIIEMLSKKFNAAAIELVSEEESLPFYIKLGFKRIFEGSRSLKKDF